MKPSDYFNVLRDAIASEHHVHANAGFLAHVDQKPGGKKYQFQIHASSPHFAFSLDVQGRQPFAVLNPKTRGLTSRCDLIVFCFSDGQPLAFLIEVKGGKNPVEAQHQIEAGAAFCRYLCDLVTINGSLGVIAPKMFGLVVYVLPRPLMGATKPKPINFFPQGKTGIPRASWDVDTPLPLSSLLSAAAAFKS